MKVNCKTGLGIVIIMISLIGCDSRNGINNQPSSTGANSPLQSNQTADLIKSADEFYEKREYARAIELYKQVLKIDPRNAKIYNGIGDAYYYQNLYDSAIENYTQATKLNPTYAAAFFNLGYAYSQIKQYKRAIENFTESVNLRPDHAASYFNRALAYSDIEHEYEAISDYTLAIKYAPKEMKHYYFRGLSFYNLKKYKDAAQDFTTVMALDRHSTLTYPRAIYYRAVSCYSMKHFQTAFDGFSHYVTRPGTPKDAMYDYSNDRIHRIEGYFQSHIELQNLHNENSTAVGISNKRPITPFCPSDFVIWPLNPKYEMK